MKIINFKKKRMKLSRIEQQQQYESEKICYIFEEKIENNNLKDKKYHKFRDYCNYTIIQCT